MLRIGLLAGLILGLTELFLTAGLDGWRGLTTGLLGVLGLCSLFGGLAGLAWSLLSRIVLPNRSQSSASQFVGLITILLIGIALGVIVHGSFSLLPKLALLVAPIIWALLGLGILRAAPMKLPLRARLASQAFSSSLRPSESAAGAGFSFARPNRSPR